jgi:hypothetical protein
LLLESGEIMTEIQDVRQFNNAEVMVVPEGISRPIITSESPMDLPVERFTRALTRREENRKALIKWVSDNLVQGKDFGKIHVVGKDKCPKAKEGRAHECSNKYHWSKPSLWKPSAEKICGMLGLIPRFPNLNEYENAVLRGEDIKVIILKCELHTPSGFIAAEGTGARRLSQDNADINKSLKMAEKSAHIDATLRVAGLSEIFTQDIEDMAGNVHVSPQPDSHQVTPNQDKDVSKASPDVSQNGSHDSGNGSERVASSNVPQRLSSRQYRYILNLAEELDIRNDKLEKRCVEIYGVSVQYLSKFDASSLIALLLAKKP